MFENEAEENGFGIGCTVSPTIAWQKGAEFGYDKANEWHYVKNGDLPRQDGHTCFSIEVLANNKKWVYYEFGSGK